MAALLGNLGMSLFPMMRGTYLQYQLYHPHDVTDRPFVFLDTEAAEACAFSLGFTWIHNVEPTM